MKMSEEQRRLVERNLGLVGKVISNTVHYDGTQNILDMDDLYQIGCLSLCEAVILEASKGNRMRNRGTFSTYAYTVIRNRVLDALRYVDRRRKKEGFYIADIFGPEGFGECMNRSSDLRMDVLAAVRKAYKLASGVKKKGIYAMLLSISGYKYADIAKIYHVPDSHVRVWVSAARKDMRSKQELIALKGET